MNKRCCQQILAVGLMLLLAACGASTPPLGIAPDGKIIEGAIAMRLTQVEQSLSQQLKASHPQLKITQITVSQIDPFYLASLPTYHLQGTYDLIITLPKTQVKQKNNLFDLYLQRQAEGKTWRLLKRDADQWSSYLIRI